VIYFFGALGALMWGYDSGVLAGALLFIRPQLHMTPTEVGLVGSALSIGSAVGAVASGILANPIGRKKLIFIASVLFAIGTAAVTFAGGVSALIWGRGILGLGIGLIAVSVPVYLSEISPASTRGKIGSLTQLMIAVGILLGYIGNLALSPLGAWRIMFAVMIVPTVVLGIGVWVLPESPRWLLRRDRPEEARALLAHQVSREELDLTMAEMQATLHTKRLTVRQMFASGLGKVIILAIVLDVLTQMMGINTIVYYAPSIMKAMGFSNATALINTVGFGVLSVIFTVFAAQVLDKWGRRPLLMVGALVMAASMATMATLSFTVGLAVGISGVIGIIALAVFKAMFSLSWGTATRVVIAEFLPTGIRAGMQGIAQLFNYGATFVITLVFPILLAAGSGFAFALFAVMGVIAFVVVLTLLPETKGQTLEEIEAKVTGAVPAIH
jgi:sugar porter (SP) family MFS transporter